MIVSAAWILPAIFAAINRIVQAHLQGWEPATVRDVLFEGGDWFLYALLTPGAVTRGFIYFERATDEADALTMRDPVRDASTNDVVTELKTVFYVQR